MKKTTGGNKSETVDGNQRARDLTAFTRAVGLFNAGKFGEAKQLFDQLATVPDTSLAYAARSRALICERRSRPS
jgi:hypothetical protein